MKSWTHHTTNIGTVCILNKSLKKKTILLIIIIVLIRRSETNRIPNSNKIVCKVSKFTTIYLCREHMIIWYFSSFKN